SLHAPLTPLLSPLSLHDALPIYCGHGGRADMQAPRATGGRGLSHPLRRGAPGGYSGRGVSAVLGGSTGYSTRGWRPVSVRRNAAIALASSSSISRPSCALPMIAT